MPDTPAKATVRLPYVLVPKMDASSRLFHKAQNTIAKQAKAAAAKQTETTSSSPTSSVTSSDQKAKMAKLFLLDQSTWYQTPKFHKSLTPFL
jgi:hypothetical protein